MKGKHNSPTSTDSPLDGLQTVVTHPPVHLFSPPLCRFGVRFPCMSDAYNRDLQQLAMEVGQELGYGDFLKEGVYCVLAGPSFETIAECRMLHMLGVDAVGE